jgi:hypothetical protein
MASKPKTGPSFLNYAKLALVGAASAAAGTSGSPKPGLPQLGAPGGGSPASSLNVGGGGGSLVYRPAFGSTAVNANAYRFNPTVTVAPGASAAAVAPVAGFRYNLGVEKSPYGIAENAEANENAENAQAANARLAANAQAKANANAKFLANARASFRNSFAAAERGGRRSTKRSNRRRNNRSKKQKQQRRH